MKILLAVGLLLALSACSGGSSRYPKGKVCPATYDPIPADVPKQEKLSMDPSLMAKGTYTYQGAEVYFAMKNGVKIHRAEGKNPKTGALTSAMKCIAGLKPTDTLSPESIAAIKSMRIEASGKVTDGLTRVAAVGFDQGKWHEPLFSDGGTFDVPSKVYEGAVQKGPNLYKLDPKNDKAFQIRATREYPDGSTLSILVYLTRED